MIFGSWGIYPKNIAKFLAPVMDNGKDLAAYFVCLNESPYQDTVGMTIMVVENTDKNFFRMLAN